MGHSGSITVHRRHNVASLMKDELTGETARPGQYRWSILIFWGVSNSPFKANKENQHSVLKEALIPHEASPYFSDKTTPGGRSAVTTQTGLGPAARSNGVSYGASEEEE